MLEVHLQCQNGNISHLLLTWGCMSLQSKHSILGIHSAGVAKASAEHENIINDLVTLHQL